MIRPITDTLRHIGGGVFIDTASDKMAELVSAVDASGGVQMSFVQDDDNQTLEKMQLFERFSIGIPVFWNGDAYRLDARLRYRVREGVLKFWYELIRPEKCLKQQPRR